MFWKKKPATEKPKIDKSQLPREMPELVRKRVVEFALQQKEQAPNWVCDIKAVVRKSPKGEKAFDIRLFDRYAAKIKKVVVQNYASLDEHPDLIVYEGWFDEKSEQVELEEKKKISSDTTIFTEAEIQQKIEGLSEPGSTVFFYVAGSPKSGGPLGRGAHVVELNPNYPGKKQKKYILYATDVEGMEPVGEKIKLISFDKPKQIADYVKDFHKKRRY